MYCNYKRIEKDIENLSKFTVKGDIGFTRFSYTKEDIDSKRYIINEMKKLNLDVSMDLLGNIFGRRDGTQVNLPPILLGSHLDSVKNGGKYDGIAGIVSGLEIIRVMNENNVNTRYPVEIVAFAEEEGGRFNSAFIGSKWFSGDLTEDKLDNILDNQNISIKSAMESLNQLNTEVNRCVNKNNNIKAMIELHCEQGPVLENKNKNLGIVNLITGSTAYQVELFGQADHAGTTPMDSRKDPFYLASKIGVELNEFVKNQQEHCVGTIGFIEVIPNVYNIVPEKVSLVMDVRSGNKKLLLNIIDHMKNYISIIASQENIKYNITQNHHTSPVKMSNNILDMLISHSESRGYSFNIMGSGAGHDTISMSQLTDCAMVFVPSKGGRSHCPEEYTDPRHIAQGGNIILDTVLELAEKMN